VIFKQFFVCFVEYEKSFYSFNLVCTHTLVISSVAFVAQGLDAVISSVLLALDGQSLPVG
jgi:hypothetical protein